MSGEEKDFPYTWEINQNAKGYMQIRFKVKSDNCPEESIKVILTKQLQNITKAVEDAGYKVQPIEEKKVK